MPRLYLAVDIGKSKTLAALIQSDGAIIERKLIPTDLSAGGSRVLPNAESLLDELSRTSPERPSGIGVCTIGIVDPALGKILKSSIPSLTGENVKERFERRLGIPVRADNDLNCPGYGEYAFGPGRLSKAFVYLTISTGAGISTILDGKVWHGTHNLAGFIGNVDGITGKSGNQSFESVFSGSGIEESAIKAFGTRLAAKDVFEMSRGNSEKASGALSIINRAVMQAGTIIASIQMTIDPDMIVVGGSVAVNQPDFVARIKADAEKRIGSGAVQLPNGINLVVSRLGQDNGILGAMAMIKRDLE
jgi:glucokinase